MNEPVVGAEGHRGGVHEGAAERAFHLRRVSLHQLHAAQSSKVATHVLAPADLLCLGKKFLKLTSNDLKTSQSGHDPLYRR